MTRNTLGRATCVLLVLGAAPAHAADADGFTLDLSADRAGVSVGDARTVWWTGRAQLTYRRAGTGGAFVAVEPLRRFDRSDATLVAAGWRHLGGWSLYAEAGATPHADFHYRRSAEIELFRRLGGPWVPHASYRYFAFPSQNVRLIQPAVTRYGRRSELTARVSFASNTTTGVRSTSVFARGRYDVTPRVTLGGGAAVGERIFDVTALSREPAAGWVAFAEARLATGGSTSVGFLARVAEEGSSFDQAAFGVSYRRSF